jgi:predicted transcriptional regulator
MERKKMDPISIRLDPEVKAALQRLAKADGRSLSGYIHHLLQQYVAAATARKPGKAAKG